jgi:hypothetical protein
MPGGVLQRLPPPSWPGHLQCTSTRVCSNTTRLAQCQGTDFSNRFLFLGWGTCPIGSSTCGVYCPVCLCVCVCVCVKTRLAHCQGALCNNRFLFLGLGTCVVDRPVWATSKQGCHNARGRFAITASFFWTWHLQKRDQPLCAATATMCSNSHYMQQQPLCAATAPMCSNSHYVQQQPLCAATATICSNSHYVQQQPLCAATTTMCSNSTTSISNCCTHAMAL